MWCNCVCIQGWYLYIVTVRWLSMRVDFLSTLYLTAVAFILILSASGENHWRLRNLFMYTLYIYTESNAGLVALGLAYTLSLADLFQYGVQVGAEVETTVSRVFIGTSNKKHILKM